jgi:hypothetical protein
VQHPVPEIVNAHEEEVTNWRGSTIRKGSGSQPAAGMTATKNAIMAEELKFFRNRNALTKELLEVARLNKQIKKNMLLIQLKEQSWLEKHQESPKGIWSHLMDCQIL